MGESTPWHRDNKPTATVDLGVLVREPADLYHARSAQFLGSHRLSDFRKSPLLYHRKALGLVTEDERPAYLVGRAAHALVLEGRARFEEEFAVGGPVNPKTGSPFGAGTKAFAEWAQAQGKPVLTDAQYELVTRLAEGVRSHEKATELLSEGTAEGVVRARYCGVSCQIRMDWFDPYRGLLDLKTCDDLTWFEADARRYGYVHQLAFYRAVLAEVIGVRMPAHLIGIEKKEPFRCGVWQVSSEALGLAERDNEQAIERLKDCQAKDDWPSGYEEIRVLDVV